MRKPTSLATPVVILVLGLLGAGYPSSSLQADGGAILVKPRTTTTELMRLKLAQAQTLLEALTLEDYDKMQAAAKDLKDISHATTWYKADDPVFIRFAKSFQNSSDNLVIEAAKKDLQGVALGYIRMTMDCLQCHSHVRAGRSQ